MSVITIFNKLNKRHFTTSEFSELESAKESKTKFLEKLVEIYKGQVQDYMGACDELPSLTAMRYAYAVFLESDRFSIASSLRRLLRQTAPDLVEEVGLNSKTAFVDYVARYRLFCSVDRKALGNLCEHVKEKRPKLFPCYLFNALRLERNISKEVLSSGTTGKTQATLIAKKIDENWQVIFQSVSSVVYYLGGEEDRKFSTSIASAYTESMVFSETQMKIFQANATILEEKEGRRVCLPCISLMGVDVTIDLKKVHEESRRIKAQLEECDHNDAETTRRFEEAKSKIHREIDDERARQPKLPITFSAKVGAQF